MPEIDKNTESEEKLNTSNIFDEFEIDDDTKQEIEEMNIKKDGVYYMKRIGIFFKYFNFVLIFIILIVSFYIFIQQDESEFSLNKDYLNSACSILNPGWLIIWTNCSWITASNILLDTKINDIKNWYLKSLITILKDSYKLESVKNSNEALFIMNKTKNKNDPIEILNKFDLLKNKFSPTLKSKIVCNSIEISWNVIVAKCSSFSTAWDEDIPGYEWIISSNNISWTSISLASSFINFVSNSENFNLIDKQKIFDKKPYFWEWKYTYTTDFNLQLEFISDLPL